MRKFVCMFNSYYKSWGAVFEEVDDDLVGYREGENGIPELSGMSEQQVKDHFTAKGEAVEVESEIS